MQQREIKFRVWAIANKEMIYFGQPTILDDESEGLLFYRQSMALKGVKRFHLMQFTGLHDLNGKEIYEGDIIHTRPDGAAHKGWQGEIRWYTGGFAFFRGAQFLRSLSDLGYVKEGASISGYEVIGNIFQNPELLNSE